VRRHVRGHDPGHGVFHGRRLLATGRSDAPGRQTWLLTFHRLRRHRATADLADSAAVPYSCGVLPLRLMRRLCPIRSHYIMLHVRP
jgi:hypothetical protein